MSGAGEARPNGQKPERKTGEIPRTTVAGTAAPAGGVKALTSFFEAAPPDTGVAFVVIVHLDPEYRSELAQILASHTSMPVEQVRGTSPLNPDCIYVIPPDRQLRISDDEIAAIPFEEPRGRRMPIDTLFRSLADQHGDGFAVILSGAGSDGTVGVKAIKEGGGIIMVQDPEEAEYPSMPRAAIATEAADVVLPVRKLAERLAELARAKKKTAAGNANEDALRRILAHLRFRTGHDFSQYKRSTLMRRVARRMQVACKDSFEEYFAYLRETPNEAQCLLADLLISVTTFFRDPPAFDSLASKVIPQLFANKDEGAPIRVWVVGCATGEEAYSIAMLLLEEAARQESRPEIQVFATDMDTRALAIAREGRYPATIAADVSEERLRRFFQRDGEELRVKRELRDLVLFANHSLLKDPPFSRIDLISCRNLLIYLNRELQQQVLAMFNYALNRDGYLFLGASETAEQPAGLFRSADREARLYRTAGRADTPPVLPRGVGLTDHLQQPTRAAPAGRNGNAYHRETLEISAPPSLVVDGNYRVIHLSESAGRYLQPAGGAFSADVTELVREELRFELRSALHRVFERGEPTLSPCLMVKFNGTAHRFFFQVRPIHRSDNGENGGRAIVYFLEGEVGGSGGELPYDADAGAEETIGRLRLELEASHSRLRTMREESEAANEELRAANEELQSINEEYRSTAEELETSKEELQSINEELQTLNSELKLKLDTVSRTNSDLKNLMAATDLPTLFLDATLRIKLFTPRTADLFNVTQADVGRPITDFTHRLRYDELTADARQVLKDLIPLKREVTARGGQWYLARILPYRTVDDKIDGVVASFIDITEIKALEARLRLLLGELTHRVKNILSVVQGLVHQTWRTSDGEKEFTQRLDGRLAALSSSHDLLVDSNWQGADLRKLVERETASCTPDSSRLRFSGEPVQLPADLATPFGLVLHELATNAVKYGALSNDNGHVDLSWKVENGGNGAVLKFDWREKGGSPAGKPASGGFGGNFIRHGLRGARVDYEIGPEGAVYSVALPISGDGAGDPGA